MLNAIAPTKTPEGDLQQIELYRQLTQALRVVLNRVYLDGVDRVFQLKIDPNGDITGIFTDQNRAYDFRLSGERLSYQQTIRKDSYLDGVFLATRLDATKKRRCKKGFSCGQSCIAKGLTCNVNARGVVSPREAIALRDMAMKLRSPAVGGKITPSPKSDPYEEMTIRELKGEAKRNLINGYSNMTSEELRESLRLVAKDPEDQDRIQKLLSRRGQAQAKALRFFPKELAKAYRAVQKASRLFGANPDLAGLLAVAVITGGTVGMANQIKQNYKNGLSDSAKLALDRAEKIPLENTGRKDIMFTVGGLNIGESKSGQTMKEFLETPQDGTKGESWFGKEHHIIAVDHDSKKIPDVGISKKNADGSYNIAYLGYSIKEGFGKAIDNFRQGGRSEASVDLASQLYAYGSSNKDARINILGHGGAETREAIEILSRMRPDKGISGKEIAQRISLVNMGTPFFGMTDDKIWKDIPNRTITSQNDPFSMLPKMLPQFVNGVKGHEVADYLVNRDVRDRIRESFGYYTSSIENMRREKDRSSAFHGNIAETLGYISPQVGKLYGEIVRVVDQAKERPFQSAIKAGALLVPVGVGVYMYARNRYGAGLEKSADLAMKQYQARYGKSSPVINQSNVMFTVGSSTTSSEDLAKLVSDPATGFKTAEKGNYQIVSDWGGNQYPPMPPDIKPGTVEYNMWIADQEYARNLRDTVGRVVQSVPGTGSQTRSPDAVTLASEMYAYAKATQGHKGWGNKNIPVLAHRSGGLVAREAIEIVSRMGQDGKALSQRMKLVTLGTPHFGFAQDSPAETAISSEGDFFNNLPRPGNSRSVKVQAKHGEARDYFENPTSKAEIERAFKASARPTSTGQSSSRKPPTTPPTPTPTPPPPAPTPTPTPPPPATGGNQFTTAYGAPIPPSQLFPPNSPPTPTPASNTTKTKKPPAQTAQQQQATWDRFMWQAIADLSANGPVDPNNPADLKRIRAKASYARNKAKKQQTQAPKPAQPKNTKKKKP